MIIKTKRKHKLSESRYRTPTEHTSTGCAEICDFYLELRSKKEVSSHFLLEDCGRLRSHRRSLVALATEMPCKSGCWRRGRHIPEQLMPSPSVAKRKWIAVWSYITPVNKNIDLSYVKVHKLFVRVASVSEVVSVVSVMYLLSNGLIPNLAVPVHNRFFPK